MPPSDLTTNRSEPTARPPRRLTACRQRPGAIASSHQSSWKMDFRIYDFSKNADSARRLSGQLARPASCLLPGHCREPRKVDRCPMQAMASIVKAAGRLSLTVPTDTWTRSSACQRSVRRVPAAWLCARQQRVRHDVPDLRATPRQPTVASVWRVGHAPLPAGLAHRFPRFAH